MNAGVFPKANLATDRIQRAQSFLKKFEQVNQYENKNSSITNAVKRCVCWSLCSTVGGSGQH